MDTKYCEHCGKEIDFEYKREKVTKTRVVRGVVTYTGETELVKKYKSAICSKCGGTFCLDCIRSFCKDKYRNSVLTHLCPSCDNPEAVICTHEPSVNNSPESSVNCTHESSTYTYVGITEEDGIEFIVHEKVCKVCGKKEVIKAKVDECNHVFEKKQLLRYDANYKYYEKTCTLCGEKNYFAEPIEKIKPDILKTNTQSSKPKSNSSGNKVDNSKVQHNESNNNKSSSTKTNKTKSSPSKNKKYKHETNYKKDLNIKNVFLVVFILILMYGANHLLEGGQLLPLLDFNEDLTSFKDENSYFESESILLPFTGAASDELYIANYHNSTDPTYDGLIKFLMNDKTDTILYDENSFVCADYAVAVHNNAENLRIRAGVVDISFYDNPDGHALNVFNTTDKGLVFVDCTGTEDNVGGNNADKIVKLEKGESYVPKPIFTSSMYYENIGTVKDYEIYW